MKNGTTPEPLHMENAGMVLFAPFLPHLFTMLELTEPNRRFKDKNAQYKAVYSMQYTVFDRIDFPEQKLVLNKLLAGLPINEALPSGIELTEQDKEKIHSLLGDVKNNWAKMRNTTIETMRMAFLQRNGKLEEMDDHYLLTVEEKPYDLLLNTLPWDFRMIKLPSMQKRIEVKWR